MSLPPRGGPWELLVVAAGVPDANRDRRTRRGLQVCLGSLQRQLLGCEYLISSRFQSFRVSEKGGILLGF